MGGSRRGKPGGIVGLYRLIQEHGEAVEADLQHHYQVALTDLGRRLSWRRLLVLIRHLPPSSSVAVLTHGPQWATGDYLLAAAVDALHGANWQRSGGKGSRPKPIPRPGDKSRAKTYGNAIPIEDARRIIEARNGRRRRVS